MHNQTNSISERETGKIETLRAWHSTDLTNGKWKCYKVTDICGKFDAMSRKPCFTMNQFQGISRRNEVMAPGIAPNFPIILGDSLAKRQAKRQVFRRRSGPITSTSGTQTERKIVKNSDRREHMNEVFHIALIIVLGNCGKHGPPNGKEEECAEV